MELIKKFLTNDEAVFRLLTAIFAICATILLITILTGVTETNATLSSIEFINLE